MQEGSNDFVALLPALVKARPVGSDGRRLVEVEASVEEVDAEGDLIQQSALLDSAQSFLSNGHLDLDHVSELGHLMQVAEPLSYILGRPLEVTKADGGRTVVLGEIKRAPDGRHSPSQNKYDAFWDTLTSQPPVLWRASVYGFMDDETTLDCRKAEGDCPGGATRFVVSKFDWRSLAFTRNPVNQGIKGYARVVSAKSWVALAKAGGLSSLPGGLKAAGLATQVPEIPSIDMISRELGGGCPTCGGLQDAPSLPLLRNHFSKCLKWPAEQSDIGAHAAMYLVAKGIAVASRMPGLLKIAGAGPSIGGPGNETLRDEDRRQSQSFGRTAG